MKQQIFYLIETFWATIYSFKVAFFDFNETKVRPKREPTRYIVGCFYTNWAQYRPDKGKFVPDFYSPGLCSHIYFAFAKMNENFTMRCKKIHSLFEHEGNM